MVITLRQVNDHIVVDIYNKDSNIFLLKTLRKTLNDLIKTDKTSIIINMTRIRSINSEILGCLISAQKKCKKKKGELSIYGVQPDILTILYIIQLDKYISIYNNELDAIDQRNTLIRRRFKII